MLVNIATSLAHAPAPQLPAHQLSRSMQPVAVSLTHRQSVFISGPRLLFRIELTENFPLTSPLYFHVVRYTWGQFHQEESSGPPASRSDSSAHTSDRSGSGQGDEDPGIALARRRSRLLMLRHAACALLVQVDKLSNTILIIKEEKLFYSCNYCMVPA